MAEGTVGAPVALSRRARKKLEKRRREAISFIGGERKSFEVMVQRAQRAGDVPDPEFVTHVLSRLNDIEHSAATATNADELDDLETDAERQAELRAYICPQREIEDEASLAIDLMQEWHVPRTVIGKLRDTLGQKVKEAEKDLGAARSALRTILDESDSWNSYTNEYEETMRRYTYYLFAATITLPALAVVFFHWALTLPLGLLCAGATGSCVSVMAKLPLLDVSLSGELEAYGRRILTRISAGIIASLIGAAFLGWGLISISVQGQTFADVLNACAGCPPPFTVLKTVILLAVPMLFGFSERALTSVEGRVFGSSNGKRKPIRDSENKVDPDQVQRSADESEQ